jgi:acetyl esterase/lipase
MRLARWAVQPSSSAAALLKKTRRSAFSTIQTERQSAMAFQSDAGNTKARPPAGADSLVHPELAGACQVLKDRDPAILRSSPDLDVTATELSALLPELRRAWAADTSHVPLIARAVPFAYRLIPGSPGNPDVGIYIVGVGPGGSRPAILHMHGGGFIVGSAAEYVPLLQAQALALDCVIVSVEYRLAPETRYPGSLEDNYAALRWLYTSCEELGVDRLRIAVQGESAGGGHAAMLAIAARDRGEIPILFQCLTYPMLDDRTGSSKPAPAHIGTICWTEKYNRMGWSALLGMEAGSAAVPKGAVPARLEDFSGLPPTFLWVGSIDLFVSENLEYAHRLAEAGVPTELHLLPGVYHGFDGAAPASAVTLSYKTALIQSMARAFGTAPHSSYLEFITPTNRVASQ